MAKKTFLTALFICMAVLGAEAQKNNVYKTDTIVDEKGNTIVNVYRLKNLAEGNGNVVTQDFEVTEFEEISMILPATVNYTVADDYSCRVTLDENLFDYLDIYSKGGCLRLEMVKTLQQVNLMPTKFVIEISAPTIAEITLTGSGDFCFVTPFEARKLKITRAGSGEVYFKEKTNIRSFSMSIAGSGKLICKDFHVDYTKLENSRPVFRFADQQDYNYQKEDMISTYYKDDKKVSDAEGARIIKSFGEAKEITPLMHRFEAE